MYALKLTEYMLRYVWIFGLYVNKPAVCQSICQIFHAVDWLETILVYIHTKHSYVPQHIYLHIHMFFWKVKYVGTWNLIYFSCCKSWQEKKLNFVERQTKLDLFHFLHKVKVVGRRTYKYIYVHTQQPPIPRYVRYEQVVFLSFNLQPTLA